MNMQEINSLIEKFSAHGLTGLELEEGNMRIAIKKELCGSTQTQGQVSPAAADDTAGQQAAPAFSFSESAETSVVKAPLVGMFYNSSSPEEEPFVKAGDAVKKGQVLGIIEAMKLMNEVTSEFDGIVREVLVENGQVVEYGQPLFAVSREA